MITGSVIYHANCVDGFGAAWTFHDVSRNSPTFKFHPGVYGKPPPEDLHHNIFMVDFSYKRSVIESLLDKGHDITILDHHETALKDLETLEHPYLAKIFDMNQSGAMLAWRYWHGQDAAAPLSIQYIQDRDLWRFRHENTKAYNAALFSYPYDFEIWDKLLTTNIADLVTEGSAIMRKHDKDTHELINAVGRKMKLVGYEIPVANLPYMYASEAGMHMSKGQPFAATYFVNRDGDYVFSLRSDGNINVAEIASLFKGGGHKTAAGFRFNKEQFAELEFI